MFANLLTLFVLLAFIGWTFTVVGNLSADIVWWIDCHLGTPRQRRIVRMNRMLYRNSALGGIGPCFLLFLIFGAVVYAYLSRG